jgi:hypothetical protein
MDNKVDPWELLAELREHFGSCGGIPDHLWDITDAALAEHQNASKDTVKSDEVVWWRDKVIRAIINGRHVTIQTNAPNHWFWSVAFVDRKDRYGMCERQDGICTTEDEAKEAAIQMARRKK